MRLATISWLDEEAVVSLVAVQKTTMVITANNCRFLCVKAISMICLLLSNTSIAPYK